MSLQRGKLLPLAVVCGAAVGIATLYAQDNPPRQPIGQPPVNEPRTAQPLPANQPRTAQPPQHAGHPSQNLDQLFAACLTYCNENEINIAKLAAQHSDDAEVKKFAEMLQKDHQQFNQDLQRFAGNWIRPRNVDAIDRDRPGRAPNTPFGRDPNAPAATTAPRTAPGQPAAPGAAAAAQRAVPGAATAPVAGGDMATTLIEIRREVADECLASARSELSNKKGDEFDACFIGMQIAAHMGLVDELTVLERHASPELQPILQKGRETAQAHLDRAKKLMKDQEKEIRKAALR